MGSSRMFLLSILYLFNHLIFNAQALPPVDPSIAALSPIPLALQGSCQAGTNYTITKVMDLFEKVNDTECIFAAGVAPAADEIPLGFNYGYLLSFLDSGFLGTLGTIPYQGDYVVRTNCKDTQLNIGSLSIAGLNVGTATWTNVQTPPTFPLNGGEYPLGATGAIVMNFTENFFSLCGYEGYENPIGLQGFVPFKNSIWPINQFVDLSRVVGRDVNDGGIITLNKGYIMPKNPHEGATTVVFYATKNFDPNFMPTFAENAPQVLTVPVGPNNEATISYSRYAGLSFLIDLDPTRIFSKQWDYLVEFFQQLNKSTTATTDITKFFTQYDFLNTLFSFRR